jgi:protein TonB
MKQFLPLLLFVCTGCWQGIPDKQLPANAVKPDSINNTPVVEEFGCQVPIGAEFPGGAMAWQKFLTQNLVYPQIAIDKEIQGTVVVRFIVEKDGSLTDVEAIKGPMELRQSAMLVIKRSPDWTPGIENGNKVRSFKMQPIVFRLEEE